MNAPEVIGCSWISEREAMGRGRAPQMLFIDAGTLDLGIVRDSALNSTNDFQIFGESLTGTGNGSTAFWTTSQPYTAAEIEAWRDIRE